MKSLSLQDSAFLWIEGRRQPMHVGGLHLYTPPEDAGPDFVTELVEQSRSYAQAVEPYNLRPVFRMGRWQWAEDDHFDLDHHFRHSSLPRPGRIRELLSLVSRLHGTLMDRSHPMWEMHIIEGLEDGRIAVYGKLHHALFDGVAAMRATMNGLSEDPALRGDAPFWAKERPPRAPRILSPVEDANPLVMMANSLRESSGIVPGVARGIWDIVRPSKSDPTDITPFQAPPTMFNVKISSPRRFAAQSYDLARIKAVGKASGATLNDVVLAMCAGALREYLISQNALPDEPLISMVPVSVRSADNPDAGNQVSIILANLATQIADPGKRLETIVASTKHAKEKLGQMSRVEQLSYAAAISSPMPVASFLGIDKVRPIFNLVISNVPGPTKPLYWNGARMDEMYPVSIPVDGQALNITLTSYIDRICFGYTACRRTVPGMQRLLDYTEQALADLETAAGI